MRAIWLILAAAPALSAAPKPVDFSREIRPILSDKCFHCHGPDESSRKAGLRLDDRDGALSKVVVAGDAAASKLWQRVSHEKKALRMPPAYSGLTLTDGETALLKRWIEEGAKWETHWAYTAPKRVEPPVVKAKGWARNAIDQFLLARLERELASMKSQAILATF